MRKTSLSFIFVLMLMVIGSVSAEQAGLKIAETEICAYDANETYYISKDFSKVVWIKKTDKGKCVVVNGKEEQVYDDVSSIRFSPDCKILAYIAQKKTDWLVVQNGKAGKKYDYIVEESLLFSGDSKRLAYIIAIADKNHVVEGKSQSKPYEKVSEMLFSKNGKLFGFIATMKGGEEIPVIDGDEMKQFTMPGFMSFSPDGSHFAFSRPFQGMFLDGNKVCDSPGSMMHGIDFSENGKSWGFSADFSVQVLGGPKKDSEYRAIINKSEFGPYKESCSDITFSKDGKRFAFYARNTEDETIIIVDGKEYAKLDEEAYPEFLFSPDGSKLAYSYSGKLFEDGQEIDKISHFASVVYNAKNKLCYVTGDIGSYYVVMGGDKSDEIEAISASWMTINDAGDSYFITVTPKMDDGKEADEEDEGEVKAKKIRKRFIVLNNKETGMYERIFSAQLHFPRYDEDTNPNEGASLVDIDKETGQVKKTTDTTGEVTIGNADGTFYPVKAAFTGPKQITFVALKDGKLYRVTASE